MAKPQIPLCMNLEKVEKWVQKLHKAWDIATVFFVHSVNILFL